MKADWLSRKWKRDNHRDRDQHVQAFCLAYPNATEEQAGQNFDRTMQRQIRSKNRGFARQGPMSTEPDAIVNHAITREKVDWIVARLSPLQLKIAYLLGIEDLSHQEAARSLGISLSQLERALRDAHARAEDFRET